MSVSKEERIYLLERKVALEKELDMLLIEHRRVEEKIEHTKVSIEAFKDLLSQ